jgi:hypothetical protein
MLVGCDGGFRMVVADSRAARRGAAIATRGNLDRCIGSARRARFAPSVPFQGTYSGRLNATADRPLRRSLTAPRCTCAAHCDWLATCGPPFTSTTIARCTCAAHRDSLATPKPKFAGWAKLTALIVQASREPPLTHAPMKISIETATAPRRQSRRLSRATIAPPV